MQKDSMKTHLEAKKWWKLAKDYFELLMMANQNEEQ